MIADGRIEVTGDTAKVSSSSRGKYYDVNYDPATRAITANDNGSYWVGYLGYPSIAFILVKGLIAYDEKLANFLRDFHWKDINQKYKNDFAQTEKYIREQMVERDHVDLAWFDSQLERIQRDVAGLKLSKLASTQKPPSAY